MLPRVLWGVDGLDSWTIALFAPFTKGWEWWYARLLWCGFSYFCACLVKIWLPFATLPSSASWIVCTVRTELCTHLLWEMPFRKGSIYIYIQPEYNAFSCWKLCIWQMKALLARKGTVDGMPCFQTTQARNGLYIYFLRNYCRSFVCNQSYKSRDEGEKKTHFLSGNGPCVEV